MTLRDLGTTGQEGTASPSSRIIEAQDAAGKSTRYHISDRSSLIRRVEFDTDPFSTMMLGDERTPVVAAFVFSDYRKITGIMTPFRIEVYLGLIKIEEMTFTSVEYNAGLADDLFMP